MKKALFILVALVLTAICYYITCEVNLFLGLMAIGVEAHILGELTDKLL